MIDKAIDDALCDAVLMPNITRFLIYDNTASQLNKGVSLHRRRLIWHLQDYYRRYGTNEGWVLLLDYSGYYPNIPHDTDREIIVSLLKRSGGCTASEVRIADQIIRRAFQMMETDVSRFSDGAIAKMYLEKVDPEINAGVDPALLTGKKMLKKGIDIGNRISQCSGIVHPYRIDNYLKIVCGCSDMARYTDDTYILYPSKRFLEDVLNEVRRQAKEIGLIVNEKKTRIQPLQKPFRHLQIQYQLKNDGKIIRKINPKAITRERRKLKAYKRLLDENRMSYPEVENAFKSWICTNARVMSWRQIYNLGALYYQLFNRRPKWKRHSRLAWQMAHRSPDWN